MSSYLYLTKANGTGSSNTITFSGIPQTYTDLVFKVAGRGTGTTGTASYYVTMNGSTGFVQMLDAANENATTSSSFPTDDRVIRYIPDAATGSWNANAHSGDEVYIGNYANSSVNKILLTVGGAASSVSNTVSSANIAAGYWNSNDAITSVSFILTSGNWATTTSIYLYVVKNSV